MKNTYELGFIYACYLWKRPDLEPMPADIHRVAEVLRQSGIEVYNVLEIDRIIVCQPRPVAVREALTGQPSKNSALFNEEYPPEHPGQTIRYLKAKGIIPDNKDDNIMAT